MSLGQKSSQIIISFSFFFFFFSYLSKISCSIRKRKTKKQKGRKRNGQTEKGGNKGWSDRTRHWCWCGDERFSDTSGRHVLVIDTVAFCANFWNENDKMACRCTAHVWAIAKKSGPSQRFTHTNYSIKQHKMIIISKNIYSYKKNWKLNANQTRQETITS